MILTGKLCIIVRVLEKTVLFARIVILAVYSIDFGGYFMRVGPNVYLRSDGRWEARYQKCVDENDRVVYGYTYGITQEEAVKKRTEKLIELNVAGADTSILASQNPEVSTCTVLNTKATRCFMKKEKFKQSFNPQISDSIQTILIQNNTPESTAFFLGLFLGLSIGEMAVLRYGDLDFTTHMVMVSQNAVSENRKLIPVSVEPRAIPMTDYVIWLLTRRGLQKKEKNYYVFTDSAELVESIRKIESSFRKLLSPWMDAADLSAEALRSTFIRRCLQSNLNIETVSLLTGVDKETLYRYFGMYIKATPMDIKRLDHYCRIGENRDIRHMNLLILGAGSHGHGVKEIAEMTGVFSAIKFLDDSEEGLDIIGKYEDYLSYFRAFPLAFPAFDDNDLREMWTKRLQQAGFLLPRLIHPSAIVSDDVEIGEGTIIMSQATVNSGVKIGNACIIAPNSMASFGCRIDNYCHLDSGCIVRRDAYVPEKTLVESREVYGK